MRGYIDPLSYRGWTPRRATQSQVSDKLEAINQLRAHAGNVSTVLKPNVASAEDCRKLEQLLEKLC